MTFFDISFQRIPGVVGNHCRSPLLFPHVQISSRFWWCATDQLSTDFVSNSASILNFNRLVHICLNSVNQMTYNVSPIRFYHVLNCKSLNFSCHLKTLAKLVVHFYPRLFVLSVKSNTDCSLKTNHIIITIKSI